MTTYSTSLRLWEGTPGDPAIKDAWGAFLNTNFTLIDSAITGTSAVSINGLTTYSLTTGNGAADQARELVQSYTGALAADCTVTLPNVPKYGWAQNATTGGKNVILTAGAGTTITIPPDSRLYWCWADGTTNVTQPAVGFKDLRAATFSTTGDAAVGGALGVTGASTFTGGTFSATLTVAGNVILAGSTTNPIGTTTSGWAVATTGSMTGFSGAGVPLLLGAGTIGPEVNFYFLSSLVGSIATTGTAVVYNTTSDARLKLDDGLISGEDARRIIMALGPRLYRWLANPGGDAEAGFFAQQVHEAFPQAVTVGCGEPGEDDFQPWQIDAGKLMPIVIAHQQDMERRLAALEGTI